MLNWNTVTTPKQHGGLGIRDPRLTNLAIGAKLWWGLVIKPKEWWAQVIRRKYFKQQEQENEYIPTTQGSPIWHILLSSSPLITQNIKRIPGNGLTI